MPTNQLYLMRYVGIPRVHEELRRLELYGIANIIWGGGNRLREIMICELATLVTEPKHFSGTFNDLSSNLLDRSNANIL